MRRRDFCLTPAMMLAAASGTKAAEDRTLAIVFQSMGGIAWPLFIAKEGGYYQKYGLDVRPALVAHPGGVAMLLHGQALMAVVGLQLLLPAETKDRSLVAVGCLMNRSTFTFISRPEIGTVPDLKGKRIAVGQIGDSTYGYLLSVLKKFGLSATDVVLVPMGAEASRRAAALSSGNVDATLLTAPSSFRMEDAGYRNLANLADYDDVFTSAGYWVRRSDLASDGHLGERLIQAHAEAIHRFYTDKAFAIKAYLAYDKQGTDVERSYDLYAKHSLFERVPYVQKGAVAAALDQQPGMEQVKVGDFRSAIDNTAIDQLVKQGFFVKLFGPAMEAEQKRQASLAFR